eukprot:349893-Chlamydomonas_euryale.AAC.12
MHGGVLQWGCWRGVLHAGKSSASKLTIGSLALDLAGRLSSRQPALRRNSGSVLSGSARHRAQRGFAKLKA